MSDIGRRLKAHWVAQGLEIRPGVAARDLAALEKRHKIVLPADLRDYFSVVNGFGGTDRDCISFWPLPSEAIPPKEQYCFQPLSLLYGGRDVEGDDQIFAFGDLMILASFYLIKLSRDSRAKNPVFFHHSDYQIAESFSEFAEKYMRNEMNW